MVADLPMQLFCCRAADNCPCPRLQPFLLLLGRQGDLGHHGQEILRFDGTLHEPILRFPLKLAPKPGLSRDQLHTGDSQHPRFIVVGQRLDDGDLVLHDQASGPRHAHATGQGLLDRRQDSEQNKSDHDRQQRENRANLFSLQIAPNQQKELHKIKLVFFISPAHC